eukprot:15438103-Alexandrium_andersonii.AAC.1
MIAELRRVARNPEELQEGLERLGMASLLYLLCLKAGRVWEAPGSGVFKFTRAPHAGQWMAVIPGLPRA